MPADQQAADFIAKLKLGAGVTATIKRQRNPKHHRKFFALLDFAFDNWEPTAATYKGEAVGKNRNQFRNDIIVLAGHYEMAVNMRDEVRLTAKSISFGSMDQIDFDALYSDVVNVVLAKILTNYTRDDLDNVINQLLSFT
ncbi:Phage protein [Janthinobacterium sp. CG23_2]|nr:Phage protein [Janthinobacterium sp. CG23_2]CUU26440.1 Phage protein [Janthinobacterium sp. CG23_2]